MQSEKLKLPDNRWNWVILFLLAWLLIWYLDLTILYYGPDETKAENALISILVEGTDNNTTSSTLTPWQCTSQYLVGVNDALESYSLLNLELDIQGERKTFGEMAEIVRKRLVSRP